MLWSTKTTVRPSRDLLDEGDGAVDVLEAHAGGRLVEQQQLGVEGQREGELEGPLLPVGEGAGGGAGPVGEADLVEQLHGAVVGTAAAACDDRQNR